MRILKDPEIAQLLAEPKPLPHNWQGQFVPKPKTGYQHEERSITVKGEAGNIFRVVLRQNRINVFDFSIILLFEDTDGKEYPLVRYNGRHSSEHTNKWEKKRGDPNCRFGPAFHIHRATERYQDAGLLIDGFAEVTPDYYDFDSALQGFLRECNFRGRPSAQLRLFEGGEFA